MSVRLKISFGDLGCTFVVVALGEVCRFANISLVILRPCCGVRFTRRLKARALDIPAFPGNEIAILIDNVLIIDAADQVLILIEFVPFLFLHQVADHQGFLQKSRQLFRLVVLIMVDDRIAVAVIEVVKQVCRDFITLQADIQFNSVLVYLIDDPGACKVGSRGGNHHAVHALFDPAFRAGLAKAHSLLV